MQEAKRKRKNKSRVSSNTFEVLWESLAQIVQRIISSSYLNNCSTFQNTEHLWVVFKERGFDMRDGTCLISF